MILHCFVRTPACPNFQTHKKIVREFYIYIYVYMNIMFNTSQNEKKNLQDTIDHLSHTITPQQTRAVALAVRFEHWSKGDCKVTGNQKIILKNESDKTQVKTICISLRGIKPLYHYQPHTLLIIKEIPKKIIRNQSY